jgi:hypothetical protein
MGAIFFDIFLIRTSFLWVKYKKRRLVCQEILPQDVGCCADDPDEGIWQNSYY